MTGRIRIPNYFIFTYQAASRSNNPQSLPPFDQSLRQSRLGTLKPLRRRTLHRRIRHSWNASRCSSLFYVVGFAGRATFLVALHRIVPQWRIRTQTRPPAYHRLNGVGLRTCNSVWTFCYCSFVLHNCVELIARTCAHYCSSRYPLSILCTYNIFYFSSLSFCFVGLFFFVCFDPFCRVVRWLQLCTTVARSACFPSFASGISARPCSSSRPGQSTICFRMASPTVSRLVLMHLKLFYDRLSAICAPPLRIPSLSTNIIEAT